MLDSSKAFSGFAVDDLDEAKRFYGETLGLAVSVLEEQHGLLQLEMAGDHNILVYRSERHSPASFTILNFPVDDIDGTVEDLTGRGVRFERYDDFDMDEKGIARGPGPQIAWFKDPAGNVLSVLQES